MYDIFLPIVFIIFFLTFMFWGRNVTPEEVAVAQLRCKENGGLHHFEVDAKLNEIFVTCNNGVGIWTRVKGVLVESK